MLICFSQKKAFKHEAVLLLVLFLTFSISSFSRVFLGSPNKAWRNTTDL